MFGWVCIESLATTNTLGRDDAQRDTHIHVHILKHLKKETDAHQDPLQFAYRTHRGTDDVVLVLLHHLHQHLDRPNTYARVLFDFSSVFNIIQPHLMTQNLRRMNVRPELVLWVRDFLTNLNHYVKNRQYHIHHHHNKHRRPSEL